MDKPPKTFTAKVWPCVFPEPASSVDERVDVRWKETFRSRTPFGDLRNMFRRHHCRTLNPYGSDTCPYAPDRCAAAFEDAVRVTCDNHPKVPVGYFIRVAKTMAAIRADAKPLPRDIRGRMNVLPESEAQNFSESHADQPEGDPGSLEPGRGDVHRPGRRPVAVGDVFASLGIQPPERRGQADAGEEGTE